MRAILTCAVVLVFAASALAAAPVKTCGVYTNVIDFAGQHALDEAVNAQPPFLKEKHKRMMGSSRAAQNLAQVRGGGFNTLFMTIYPIWGTDWWEIPAARGLIKDALMQSHGAGAGAGAGVRVHLGLSLFNGNFCDNPARYPGALRTIQCDGTRPSWVCFFDDELWKTYTRNVVEFAKLGTEVPGALEGIFIDPEAYGPECYLCFCDNCVRKFNAYANVKMPTGLVKPDGWLHEKGLWKKYTVDWHDQEVRRHATELRQAIHAVDANLQLSSLLWDYPVAVGAIDPRTAYYRQLAIGLGTSQKPAWTLPEHTYYADAEDLARIIRQIETDVTEMGAAGTVKVLPGIRVLRRDAASLAARGRVIQSADVPGYWMYEMADLCGKAPIEFEGTLVDPPQKYWNAFAEMNRLIEGR